MSGEAKPGLLFLIGIAALAGAATLAWLSSVETLHFTRTDDGVTVSLRAQMFALVPIREVRVEHVSSAETVTTIPDVSRARPFTTLLFHTPTGPVNLWSTQTIFVRAADDIKAFFADPSQPEATVSGLVDFNETIRFGASQLAVLFLAFCGLGVIYLAARSSVGSDRGIGPIDVKR
jgi:hypothetical protein